MYGCFKVFLYPKKKCSLEKTNCLFKNLDSTSNRKLDTIGQSQKRCSIDSSWVLQNVQLGLLEIPIANKRRLVPKMRCKNLNWKYWILTWVPSTIKDSIPVGMRKMKCSIPFFYSFWRCCDLCKNVTINDLWGTAIIL